MKPGDLHGKKILYGCLDWGGGHVSRSIPLISQLTGQGNSIIIWCSKEQEAIFRQFDLKVAYHTGFETDFHFKGDGNFFKEMLRNVFRLWRNIRTERREAAAFALENEVDLIISDHRYGLHSPAIASVFVTHQTRLPERSGWLAQSVHHLLLKRFSFVWIMDDENERLAGSLSQKVENSSFIGHYSRFALLGIPVEKTVKYAAIISGPGVYAAQFYREIIKVAEKDPLSWLIVCPEFMADRSSAVKHFHNWKESDKAISAAEIIVSRCGYSTLMDLKALDAKAILIPTPGQLEQEYLQHYLPGKNEKWKFAKNIEDFRSLIAEAR